MSQRPFASSLPKFLEAGVLASKEFQHDGTRVWVGIGRPVQFAERAGWRCRVRVERGTRLEQSQVVAPSEREVLRLALELVTIRLGLTESQLLDGATTDSSGADALLAASQ